MGALTELSAKDILIKNALPEYKQGMKFFAQEQLVPLNVNIYIMEKIFEFPLYLFTDMEKRIFFNMVLRNFFEAGLLIITRISTDKGANLYTLTRFKNWLWENVRTEYREPFQERLKKAKFDIKSRELFEKAKQIRHASIAHVKKDLVLGSLEVDPLAFNEFKVLRDKLNFLLDTLAFNVEYRMLPIPYDPRVEHPVGVEHKTDIEELLDCVARNSYLLNMPEEHPAGWLYEKERLTDRDLNLLNQYRTRFNLPRV